MDASESADTAKEESSSADAPQAPIFEIKKWSAVTMWSWDICSDACAICRNSLNEPSIEYQVCVHSIYFLKRGVLLPSFSFWLLPQLSLTSAL